MCLLQSLRSPPAAAFPPAAASPPVAAFPPAAQAAVIALPAKQAVTLNTRLEKAVPLTAKAAKVARVARAARAARAMRRMDLLQTRLISQ